MQSTPIPSTQNSKVQIVAGLFKSKDAAGFAKALAEFQWTIRQNAVFWKDAVVYCDPEAWVHVRPHASAFREVVVDDSIPEFIRLNPIWSCKVWWGQKALERFPRVLFCDFDLYVLRQPDETLDQFLNCPPRFLYMPGFRTPAKQVCCGVVYYERDTPDFEKFLELAYHKWNSDERAWTEVLSITGEQLLASGRSLTPYIVDYSWLLTAPAGQPEPYLIHAISCVDDGIYRMRNIGYGDRPFDVTLKERFSHWKHSFFRCKHAIEDLVKGRR